VPRAFFDDTVVVVSNAIPGERAESVLQYSKHAAVLNRTA
jgi:hypothetical protein